MSTDPRRVHARASTLTCDEWLSVLAFPSTCATVGKRCPKWVRALCEFADATGQAVPRTLLDALGRGEPHGKTSECDRDAASVGEALGLCIVQGSAGPTVQIMPTPFGFAVWFVRHVRAIEAHLSALGGTPRRTRLGVATPRLEAHRRPSAALSRVMPPGIDHQPRAVTPSVGHDSPRALPPSIHHEDEGSRT
ncbi:hypothetical protein [Paraliomyxa miuraensis]|uniref:hypothetical protein n=1 Tax=Paraliomyxa miuraensis TaxID=376150 RepID=UPI00224CFB2A|nr:hypothetical protein [Paraliomyxa miuraensis]MCX4239607.1 hypothetical protein [Paraliomyxa miuraensis]